MTKSKIKILLTSISAFGLLTGGCLTLGTLSSCAEQPTPVEDDGIDYVIGEDKANATYWEVTFKAGAQEGVKFVGSTKFTIKNGRPLATLALPQAIKEGCKFYGWCLDLEKPEILPLSTPVKSNMVIYPYFEKPIELKNTVSLAFIEETDIWFDDGAVDGTVVKYSKNYGKKWETLPEGQTQALKFYPGENIFLISENKNGFSSRTDINQICFSKDGSVNIGGSIMGLIDGGQGTAKDKIPEGSVDCFEKTFYNNPAIKYVSDTFLPATTLGEGCYLSMFEGCTNLRLAPSLPATTLVKYCYESMFKNCKSLDMLNIEYTGKIAHQETDGYFNDWLSGIETDGQLIYHGTSLSDVTEKPTKWNVVAPTKTIDVRCVDSEAIGQDYKFVVDHPYHFKAYEGVGSDVECKNITWVSTNTDVASVNPNTGVVTPIRANKKDETCEICAYSKLDWEVVGKKSIIVREIYTDADKMGLMTVKATADNTSISWDFTGAGTVPNFKWSTDGHSWRKLWPTAATNITKDTTIYIKGDNPDGLNGGIFDGDYGSKSHTNFAFTGKVEIGGNIMGLIDDGRTEKSTIPTSYCFNNLFSGSDAITTVSSNFLSKATTLSVGCYYAMFQNCTNLTQGPNLTATTLKDCDNCYEHMFFGCSSLETAPTLSATVLAPYCYSAMFYLSGLTSTPALPVEAAVKGCYYMMFQYCYSLNTWNCIGKVSLKSLEDYSCYQTFAGDYYYEESKWQQSILFLNDATRARGRLWEGKGKFVFNCPDLTPDNRTLKEPVTRMFSYWDYVWDQQQGWVYSWTTEPVESADYYR